MRKVFLQAGFAKYYDESGIKLLPCPRGTFVNISDTSPKCKKCPAGKLTQILCIKLAHSCIQESNTKNLFKVRELCLKGPRTYLARVSEGSEISLPVNGVIILTRRHVANLRASPANLKTLRGNLFLSGGLQDDIEM